MSKSNHFQRLPVEVDPFRLVEQRRVMDGRIPVGDFPRLAELLVSNTTSSNIGADVVAVHLEFTNTDTGLAAIQGSINADFNMLCQRCLKEKIESFRTEFEVVFVTSDEQAERLQEGFDTWFVEDQKLFLQDFIEDEILLALPISVTHDVCEASRNLIEVEAESNLEMSDDNQAGQKGNPFAVLKDLKLN